MRADHRQRRSARAHQIFSQAELAFSARSEYEPEDGDGNVDGPVNEAKIKIAHLFKRYRDAGLLLPVEEGEQLFWTARWGHEVKLTARGMEYWGRVSRGVI